MERGPGSFFVTVESGTQQTGHIRRQRSLKGQHRPADRVAEGKPPGVEGGTGDQSGVLGAVKPVAGQRVTDGSHVEAQLVGAAGPGLKAQQGEPPAVSSVS